MEIIETSLPEVKIIRPNQHGDGRGWFAEVFNAAKFSEAGLPSSFVQDNQSFSQRGVLRGLHYQLGRPQGKLVRAIAGEIWDVAVDLRPRSQEFGSWFGMYLNGNSLDCLWIPEGFAHGFLVLSETATVLYKTTASYYPEGERCVRWDDPTLAVDWPLASIGEPTLSGKDARAGGLTEVELPG